MVHREVKKTQTLHEIVLPFTFSRVLLSLKWELEKKSDSPLLFSVKNECELLLNTRWKISMKIMMEKTTIIIIIIISYKEISSNVLR